MKNNRLDKIIRTQIRKFLNESNDDSKLSEIKDGEIRVNKKFLINLCRGVGEGISDFDANSMSKTGKWTPNTDEFQNEIMIRFIDNADRKSTRLNSSHVSESRMPSSA